MASYIVMYTRSQKGIKMNLEITMGLYSRGMKSFPSVCFMLDCALFWMATVIACIMVLEAYYTKFVQVESVMTTFIATLTLGLQPSVKCKGPWGQKCV